MDKLDKATSFYYCNTPFFIMRYRVFFTTGESIAITPEEAIVLTKAEGGQGRVINTTAGLLFFNLNNITHIAPEETLDNAQSGVLTPPTPHELRTQQEKNRQKLISDPNALLRGIKQKAEGDE